MADFDIQNGVLVRYMEDDKHVIITEGVTTIALNSFVCSHIESVIVPEGVIGIEHKGFSNCHQLENITLPDSLLYINMLAFEYCESLKYNESDGALYLGNDENPYLALIKANQEKTEKNIFREDIKVIAWNALYKCNNIVDVVIPQSVRGISYAGFWGCEAMKSIVIPNSVIHIGEYAFRYCTSLSKVVVSEQFAENNSAWWKERFDDNVLPIIALDNFDKNAPLTKYILRDKVALVEHLFRSKELNLYTKCWSIPQKSNLKFLINSLKQQLIITVQRLLLLLLNIKINIIHQRNQRNKGAPICKGKQHSFCGDRIK